LAIFLFSRCRRLRGSNRLPSPICLHERAGEEHGARAEADGVADAAGFEKPGAASATVTQRVHRDALLAGIGSRAGGLPPGLLLAYPRRLTRAAFRAPALRAAGGKAAGEQALG
jgi:hypothetical protein